MADQTEKPKLGTRPPLGLKRTVETGKVKQSFSHGRSNTVVVEVKKRRILGRPGEAPPAPPPEPIAEAPKPGPKKTAAPPPPPPREPPPPPPPEPTAEAPKPAPNPAPAAPQPRKPSAQEEITNRKELQ